MRNLTSEEKEFLEYIENNHYKNKKGGYICFIDKLTKKKYKRSRVLMQLHLNKKLEIWENVHHKDGNKENDSIENLEVKDTSEHISYHHSGERGRKNKPRKKSNKLKQNVIDKIFELSKNYEKKPNYSQIGKELGISGLTVSNYLNNK